MRIAVNRWWDWAAVLCFTAALITVSYRLSDTKWTENLNLVTTLTILGIFIGLALGLSRFSRLVVTLIGIGYSILLYPWQMSKIIEGDVLFREQIVSAGGRLWNSLSLFLSNEPLTDSILFLANMALLFWIMALTGAYSLTRHGKPWVSMAIAGIALLVIDIYHPAVGVRGSAMGVFAILTLLLITRMHFLRRKREWDSEEITVDSDTGFSWGRVALVSGIVLVVLAWNITSAVKAFTPNTSEHRRVVNLWTDIRNRFENVAKPLRGTTVVPREYFGDQFSLGTGSQLSDRAIFTVESNIRGRAGVPYYWRVRSYDRYLDGHWESTLVETPGRLAEYQRIEYEDSFNSRVSTSFRFFPERNLSMLYAPTMPLTISRRVSLISDSSESQLVDVTAVVIDPMIRAGETYEVVSLIASPTIAQLRGARTNYPEWTEKYLQLPEDMPQSIRDLADQITFGLDNSYDKAAAVTSWLRENIEYSQVLPNVPNGKDPIEWMLFDQKQAFCNYYATAQVLMLRHLGIPARWTAGYAQGEYDRADGSYLVRESDSHAWPEVFFPAFGWVEFEPTASQSVIRRPSGAQTDNSGSRPNDPDPLMDEGPVPDPDRELPTNEENATPSNAGRVFWEKLRIAAIIGTIIFIPLLGFLMFRMGKSNRRYILPVAIQETLTKRGWKVPVWVNEWSIFVELTPMEKVFIQLGWMLKLLGIPVSASATPAEQVRLLTSHLPEAAEPASILLNEYQHDSYSRDPGDIEAAGNAVKKLWKLTVKDKRRAIIQWISPWNKTKTATRTVGPD